MSKCIDCLHYEACKDTHDICDPACRGEFDYEELARSCKNFTDGSEGGRNMKFLIKKRGTGKTTGLLFTSEATGYPIIVDDKKQVETLKSKANELGITIPEPMTSDTFRGDGRSHCLSVKGILIDEADNIIEKALVDYFSGANIVAVTMTPNNM